MHELTVTEMFAEAMRLSKLIDAGIEALRELSKRMADTEQTYRLKKAQAWVRVRVELDRGTVPEREAWVNGECAAERHDRDMAEGLRQAALESVRARRAQLSAIQTMANAHQSEASLARTGPGLAA